VHRDGGRDNKKFGAEPNNIKIMKGYLPFRNQSFSKTLIGGIQKFPKHNKFYFIR
jgi:hypothetical protein